MVCQLVDRTSLLMMALALVCVWCATDLWRAPSRRAWAVLGGSGSVMVVAHLVVMNRSIGMDHHMAHGMGDAHGAATGGIASLFRDDGLMHCTLLLAMIEMLVSVVLLVKWWVEVQPDA